MATLWVALKELHMVARKVPQKALSKVALRVKRMADNWVSLTAEQTVSLSGMKKVAVMVVRWVA